MHPDNIETCAICGKLGVSDLPTGKAAVGESEDPNIELIFIPYNHGFFACKQHGRTAEHFVELVKQKNKPYIIAG